MLHAVFTQLIDFDHRLFRFFNNVAGYSEATDILFVLCAEVIVFFLVAGLGVYIYSKRMRPTRLMITLEALIAAAISRAIFVSIIRAFVFRPRPFVSAEVTQLIPHNASEGSFPSGHSAFMFGLAISLAFHDKKWGAVYLTLAAISAVSRVIVGVHYPLDVIAGVLVGIIAALFTRSLLILYEGSSKA